MVSLTIYLCGHVCSQVSGTPLLIQFRLLQHANIGELSEGHTSSPSLSSPTLVPASSLPFPLPT